MMIFLLISLIKAPWPGGELRGSRWGPVGGEVAGWATPSKCPIRKRPGHCPRGCLSSGHQGIGNICYASDICDTHIIQMATWSWLKSPRRRLALSSLSGSWRNKSCKPPPLVQSSKSSELEFGNLWGEDSAEFWVRLGSVVVSSIFSDSGSLLEKVFWMKGNVFQYCDHNQAYYA